MFSLRPLAVLTATLTLVLGVPALAASAVQPLEGPVDTSAVQLSPGEQNGITYLSGGIGEDEAKAIRQTRGYNLHLEFYAGPSDEFTSDVDLNIQSADGKHALALSQVGPIVLVKLPDGNYLVTCHRNGYLKKENIVISGNSTKSVSVHWNSTQ